MKLDEGKNQIRRVQQDFVVSAFEESTVEHSNQILASNKLDSLLIPLLNQINVTALEPNIDPTPDFRPIAKSSLVGHDVSEAGGVVSRELERLASDQRSRSTDTQQKSMLSELDQIWSDELPQDF